MRNLDALNEIALGNTTFADIAIKFGTFWWLWGLWEPISELCKIFK